MAFTYGCRYRLSNIVLSDLNNQVAPYGDLGEHKSSGLEFYHSGVPSHSHASCVVEHVALSIESKVINNNCYEALPETIFSTESVFLLGD
jgi:hypothetical protein